MKKVNNNNNYGLKYELKEKNWLRVKNQNLKSKHWWPNSKYHQTLNWRVKIKRKNKFT